MVKKGDTPQLKAGRETHILNVTKKHFYPILRELNNKVNLLTNKVNSSPRVETRNQTIHTHSKPININPTLKVSLFNEIIGVKFFPIETGKEKKEKYNIEQIFRMIFTKFRFVYKKLKSIEDENNLIKSQNLTLKKEIKLLKKEIENIKNNNKNG